MPHGIDHIVSGRADDRHPRDASSDPASDERNFPAAVSRRGDFSPERGGEDPPPAATRSRQQERRSSPESGGNSRVQVKASLDTLADVAGASALFGGLL